MQLQTKIENGQVSELAEQLVKQGIAMTRLDAVKMAENMLNKTYHNSSASADTHPQVQVMVKPRREFTINTDLHSKMESLHAIIQEQHEKIAQLHQELSSIKQTVSQHGEHLQKIIAKDDAEVKSKSNLSAHAEVEQQQNLGQNNSLSSESVIQKAEFTQKPLKEVLSDNDFAVELVEHPFSYSQEYDSEESQPDIKYDIDSQIDDSTKHTVLDIAEEREADEELDFIQSKKKESNDDVDLQNIF